MNECRREGNAQGAMSIMTPRIVFVDHEASFMSTMETGVFLSYDRLGKQEVRHHLAGGDHTLNRWLGAYGIQPGLRLASRISPPGFSI
jgi:hypothetical protein